MNEVASIQGEKSEELKVFISHRESVCGECKQELGSGAWIMLAGEKGALCLSCADLDHLIFLPPGNVALTRRARKHSILSAVVLKWSRARRRYERQGLLVEAKALEKAEKECLADAEIRVRRQEREGIRREEIDRDYMKQFAARIRELYPGCPVGREREVAEHACRKYTGRIGRSSSAKALDEGAVRIALIAHIRHRETKYDELLGRGYERFDARDAVEESVYRVLEKWQRGAPDAI